MNLKKYCLWHKIKMNYFIWYHAYDQACADKKNLHIKEWGDGQVKLNLSFRFF